MITHVHFGRCCVPTLRYRAEAWKNVSVGFDAEDRLATAFQSKEELRKQLTLDRDAWKERALSFERELREVKLKGCSEDNGSVVIHHQYIDGGKGVIVCKTFNEIVEAIKTTTGLIKDHEIGRERNPS